MIRDRKAAKLMMPEIKNIARICVPPQYSDEFHSENAYELLHIIKGSMVLQLESGLEYRAGKNDTIFIPQRMVHRDIFNADQGLELFYVSFFWKQGREFFCEAAPDCLISLPPIVRDEIIMLFEMMRIDRYSTAMDLQLADARLAHLLGLVRRALNDAAVEYRSHFDRLASLAKSYMAAHLAESIDVQRVADYLHISRATLARAFRDAGDLSFNGYLTALRMERAQLLFKESAMSVAECAERCGYSNASYFSRVFKKHFGFSPRKIS